MELHIACC